MGEVGFSDLPIVVDETLPVGTCYMMPAEVYDLIDQAKRGLLDWGYVIEEVTQAARDGYIGKIENIG